MRNRGTVALVARDPKGTSLVEGAVWNLRFAAFAVIAIITLRSRSDDRAVIVAALVVIAMLMASWAAADLAARRGRHLAVWVLTLILAGIGIVGGLLAALPASESLVAFTVIVAIGAGSQLTLGPACAVAATGIMAIEISSLVFGFDNGDIGWPLAVIAGTLAGRQRQDSRALNAQTIALVEQAERTRTQEQHAATLDERARIAREIHDLLAHSLGALGIQVEAAQALLVDTGDIDRALPLLDQARRLAASGLEETRRAIEALRSDTPPLPESLSALADGHTQQHHTPAELTVIGDVRPLSAEVNLALIRVAHEALANAAKHAPSAAAAMTLEYELDRTTVTVRNGASTEPGEASPSAVRNAVAGGGYGLAGMRERLLLIGGTLTAGQTGSGWTVRAEVPS
jgi:signal transduction histidine kinase